jgi:flagellar hook-associated protein 2
MADTISGSLNLSGLSSGMDTQALIQQLMQVESRKLALLQNNLATFSNKKTAMGELDSKVGTFKTALNNMSSLSKLKAFDTTSSDTDILTASASPSATEGSHSVQIKQLATAERLVHNGAGFSSASSLVGAGTFIYSYNYHEVTITTTDKTTLQELVTKINADSNNPGITASLLEYDDGGGRWHMVLAGKDTGQDNQISINSSSTELKTSASKLTLKSGGSNATATTRMSDLATYSDSTTVTLTASTGSPPAPPAKNHAGGDVTMTFNVNSYSTVQDLMDAIEQAYGDTVNVSLDEGFIKVTDKTSGASQTDMALSFTGGAQSHSLGFNTIEGGSQTASLASFNAASFTTTQHAKNALIKVDGYPQDVVDPDTHLVTQENWIGRETNSISDVIAGVTLNLQATTETTPGSNVYNSLSVSLTRNTETLKENLKAMIEAYNAIVGYIKDKTTYDTENKKMGILSDSYSISSISSLLTSPLQSLAGGFTSSDAFTTPQDIGLKINGDGMLELNSETFNDAVSKDYNAVLNLIGAQQNGTSNGNDAAYISFYGAAQNTQAGSYDVRVHMTGTTIDGAEIKLTSEDWSKARPMTVSGNTLYGNSQRISGGAPLHPEYSLTLTVDTNSGKNEMATTVNVRQGFGDKLYDMVSEMMKSKGRIDLAQKSIDDQISKQQDRIQAEQDRLQKYQQALKSKYARLEATLSQIQQQMSSVSTMR